MTYPRRPSAHAPGPSAFETEADTGPFAKRAALSLAAILTVALVLRLSQLGESVWFDELWSTHIRLYTLGDLVRVSLRDVHPPAYEIFMFFWIRLFGDSEISIRLPPLLLGLGAIVLTYYIARSVLPPWMALLAAFLLAVSPAHIWYPQAARSYSAVVFLGLLAVQAQAQLLGRANPGRWWWTAYGAAVGIGVLTHYYVVALVGVLAAIAFAHGGRRAHRLLAIDLVAILCLATLVFAKRAAGTFATEVSYLSAFTPTAMGRLFFEWFVHGNTIFRGMEWRTWPLSALPWAVRLAAVALLLLGIRHLFRYSGRRAIELLGYTLAVPALLLTLGLIGFGHSYIARSALVSLPFFLILIAAGIGYVCSTAPHGLRPYLVGSAGVLALIPALALSLQRDVPTVYKPNPDWRAAAAYLAARRDSQPLLVFATSPATSLIYYGVPFSERHADFYPVTSAPPTPAAGSDTTKRIGRIKHRINQLTAFGDDLPPAFKRGSPDELIYLGRNPDSIVPGVLQRTGRTRFYVIRMGSRLNGFDRPNGPLVDASRYAPTDTASFRGLLITEMRVIGALQRDSVARSNAAPPQSRLLEGHGSQLLTAISSTSP